MGKTTPCPKQQQPAQPPQATPQTLQRNHKTLQWPDMQANLDSTTSLPFSVKRGELSSLLSNLLLLGAINGGVSLCFLASQHLAFLCQQNGEVDLFKNQLLS